MKFFDWFFRPWLFRPHKITPVLDITIIRPGQKDLPHTVLTPHDSLEINDDMTKEHGPAIKLQYEQAIPGRVLLRITLRKDLPNV